MGNSHVCLNAYYCPHCGKLVMKGRVNRLNMICPHCSVLIEARGEELLKPVSPEE
ncbi:MAG: hypothetical protein MI747_08155 [Desulfobacterales bacterium]|nr:hypothetical protein [Desulfobacterales bacterium]